MENQTQHDEFLEHHGVKGMRWGIRRTPAQLGHPKSERKAPSKSSKGLQKFLRKKVEKRNNSEKRNDIDEKKAAKKAQREIARREKILSNPTLLYKHRKEFSPEEIRKAMSNIQMEQSLQQLSANQLSAGATYINAALKYADAGIKTYNNAAKIYNAFSKSKNPMPIIGSGEKKKKKKDDD